MEDADLPSGVTGELACGDAPATFAEGLVRATESFLESCGAEEDMFWSPRELLGPQ
jgi:hypothetical protein